MLVPAEPYLTAQTVAGDRAHAYNRGALLGESTRTEGALHRPCGETFVADMLTRCQRGGELQAASETADYARRLDLQDRYLNSKCSLYFLRADKPKEAEDCMLLFTKVRPRQLQLSLTAHCVLLSSSRRATKPPTCSKCSACGSSSSPDGGQSPLARSLSDLITFAYPAAAPQLHATE